MTSSQPPPLDASSGQGPGGGRHAGQGDSPVSGPVRPATLAGSVLALLTYLCGFFGAYDLFFPMTLVLAGGLLALLGMLPRVGRVLVPASVLAATGFFLLLLNATSPGYSTGAVKWVALALALLSAAAIVTALLFEVGVLTAPAPRPARPPQAPPGWSPYGGGYGAPGQQPGPGQPGLFEQGQPPYGQPPQYGYGAPQGYQGYGTPGYQSGVPGNPGPASTGGYGAVGAGGAGAAGAAGYGQGYGAPAYGSQGYQGYGTPGYSAPGTPYGAAGQPVGSSLPGTDGPAGAPGPSDGTAAAGPSASPGYGSTPGDQGGVTSTGPSSATGGSPSTPASGPASTPASTPASAPTLAPMGDSGPEATTPGVPANGGDTLADADDERTRSFRPGENP